jgi:putative endonuclease
MNRSSRQELGAWGEDQALTYLISLGMKQLDRNFRIPEGEIDLILDDSGTLVFVEVKTRKSFNYGSPEESITRNKMQRIYKAAIEYLERNECGHAEWRVDVVAIQCTSRGEFLRLDHYPNIEILES